MSRKTQRYSKKFKAEAVRTVLENQLSISEGASRLSLPEGTLGYFDLVDVKESVNEVVFYLEEKNIVPEKYTDQDTESKGFYDPVIVQDFPLRGKKVFLNIRRRRWLLKKHNEYISRNWRMVAEGTRMTQDFASFLKELY